MKILNKGVCFILVLVMILGFLPVEAMAAGDVRTVDFKRYVSFDNSAGYTVEHAVISGIDANGNVIWKHTTEKYGCGQLDSVEEIGTYKDTYFYTEHGTVVALDIRTGAIKWKNSDLDRCGIHANIDNNGTIYLCGSDGPDLFIVDINGNTLARVWTFDKNFGGAYKIVKLSDRIVAISYEYISEEITDRSVETLYVDINDLSYSASIESMTVGNFYDVSPKAWYASGVQWAVDRGITVGTAKNTFSPSANCTNAQILTFIWRFAGQPESKIANPFTNTILDGYFKAAKWAYEMGLVSGSIFDSDTLCTRAMAMTHLWKISGQPQAPDCDFTDVPADADYAQAIAWAVSQGITAGTSDTTFSPNQICNRGQIVTFLHRYATNVSESLGKITNNDQPQSNTTTQPSAQFHEVTNEMTATALSIMANRIYQENQFASSINLQNKIFTRENWRIYEEDLLDSLVDRMSYDNMRSIGTYIGEDADTFVDIYAVTQPDFEAWMNYYYGTDAATPPTAGLYQNGIYRVEGGQGFIGDDIQITHVYSFSNGKYYVQFSKIQEAEETYSGSGYAVLYWAGDHYQVYELGWDTPQIPDERLAYHCGT